MRTPVFVAALSVCEWVTVCGAEKHSVLPSLDHAPTAPLYANTALYGPFTSVLTNSLHVCAAMCGGCSR